MFSTNTTIDDNSPLIVYEPKTAWNEGNNETEPHTNYWGPGGTKTWTNTLNATATFKFNGTSITIVGARRWNHGKYTVTLDGETQTFDGHAQRDQFQKEIFTQRELVEGMHTVIVRNTGAEPDATYLDIDCIYWNSTSDVGSSVERKSAVTQTQDTDPAFVYSPPGSWNMNPTRLSEFLGSSGHSTNQIGAAVNYTFTGWSPLRCGINILILAGETLSIFGTVGPNNARYTVHLDNSLVGTYDATKENSATQIPLFYASNLGPGDHSVSLVNGESNKVLEIDYAEVSFADREQKIVTTTGMPLPTPSQTTPLVPGRSRLTTGAIVGITLSCIIFILLIVSVWLLNRRNKALWHRLQSGYMVQSQFDSASTHSLNAALIPTTGAGYASRKGASESTQRSQRTDHTKESSNTSEKYDHLPSFLPLRTDYDTAYHPPERTRELPPPPVRSETGQTYATASTLVAEDGSQAGEERMKFTLLPRWGSIGQRQNVLLRDTLPSPRRTPSPSSRLLRDELADDEFYSSNENEYMGYMPTAPSSVSDDVLGKARPPA